VDQLLVALDVESAAKAIALADSLRGIAGGFKIGSRLFTSEGPTIVRALVEKRDRVFLDLKFHDIPNTVAQAVSAAASLGVWMLNVHASGGAAMLQAARAAADRAAERHGRRPLLIAVTVLTSLDAAALAGIGIDETPLDHAVRLAELARREGCDGVVASPQETAAIRRACGTDFLVVTPGIRGAAAERDDQARTMTPADAIRAGSSYLVIGRPVTGAQNPRDAAERIAGELAISP